MYIEQDKLKMFLRDAGLVGDQAIDDAVAAV
jgi:hypothetical protein